jgi:hypothetical protein
VTKLQRDVQRDFDWQRQFIPQMKMIAGLYLIGESAPEEDAERNTDLIVLNLRPHRIACRVRHYDQLRYADEFTIRCYRPSGAKTELAKIIEGFGDYILYGFADADEHQLCAWMLGDLNVFRLWHSQHLARNHGREPGTRKRNGDGTEFIAYRIADLPADFVVTRNRAAAKEAA